MAEDDAPATAWHRFLVGKPTRSQWIVGGLCALLGFGIVLQVRSINSDEVLSTARSEDLIRVLDALDARSERLDRQIDDLTQTRDSLAGARDKEAAAAGERLERERDLAILAGTIETQGPGVELTFTGPTSAVLLLDTIQELRDAGAEALQVGDVRVIASTSFLPGSTSGEVLVDGQAVASPITVLAIGGPGTMSSALRIPGGIADAAVADGITLDVRESDQVTVSAVVPLTTADAATPTDEG